MKPAASMEHATATIFVADHDERSREHLGSVLSTAGYDVRLLESIDRLIACKPPAARCCLVMDHRFQGVNGLDLWTQFTTEQTRLPVVFMSAHANLAAAVRAIKAGAVDFLAKPVCEDALLDAVHIALEQDAARQTRQSALRQVEALYGSLSPREREVMRHVTAGLMNKQVAGMLGLSEITVKVHRGHVMRKMNARTFADLVRQADHLQDQEGAPGHARPLPNRMPITPLPAARPPRPATLSVLV